MDTEFAEISLEQPRDPEEGFALRSRDRPRAGAADRWAEAARPAGPGPRASRAIRPGGLAASIPRPPSSIM